MAQRKQTAERRKVEGRARKNRFLNMERSVFPPVPKDDPQWRYVWVRRSLEGKDDPRNLMHFLQRPELEMEPVTVDHLPHLQQMSLSDGAYQGVIFCRDCILCRYPREVYEELHESWQIEARQLGGTLRQHVKDTLNADDRSGLRDYVDTEEVRTVTIEE